MDGGCVRGRTQKGNDLDTAKAHPNVSIHRGCLAVEGGNIICNNCAVSV